MRMSKILAASVSMLALANASNAFAQAGNAVDEVVVTGSRIVRDGYEAPTPVTVTTAAELRAGTPTTLSDALNQLPQFAGSIGPGREVYNNTGVSKSSGNFLALRNLGPNRTLVMLESRRLPPTTFDGLVDAGIVPEMLVQRVDVVTGGVSAVYGSDAVTGVVNYILDKNFTGLKARAQFGFSNYSASGFSYFPNVKNDTPWLSDGKSFRIGAAGGASLMGDRAHVLFSAERSSQDEVVRPDRPYSLESWGFASLPVAVAGPGGTARNPYTLTRNVFRNDLNYSGKIVTGPASIAGFEIVESGTAIRPWDNGTPTAVQNISVGGVGKYTPQIQVQIPGLVTDQLFGQFRYDVTDKLEASLTGTYTHSKGDLDGSGTTMTNFRFISGNPFMPAAVQAALAPLATPTSALNTTNSITMSKRQVANYPLEGEEANKVVTLTAGLKGEFLENWTFDTYYSYGRSRNDFVQTQPVNSKWYAATDVVLVNGQPTCYVLTTQFASQYPGCVPYNAFGLNNASDAAKAYILGDSTSNATHTTHIVSGSVSGELFETWAGPIGVSAGAEYRKLSLDVFSNADPREPISATNLAFPYAGLRNLPAGALALFQLTNRGEAHGGTNVKEVFGEIAVPLAKDMPLFHSLEFSGAARRTDYSSSGAVTTWKAGLTWEPTAELRLRGAISRDIRAPTLVELFATSSSQRQLPIDPFTSVTQQADIFTRGNPNLVPEVGKTKTLGLVYRPEWAPRFGVSVDYYDIDITGAVGTLPFQQILNDCFASNGVGATCDAIIRPFPITNRTPANFPSGINVQPLNLAFISTRGIDLDVNYNFDLDSVVSGLQGNLALRGVVGYVDRFLQQNTSTSVVQQLAGCTCGALPKYKALLSSTYTNDGFTFRLQSRVIGRLNAGPEIYVPNHIPVWVYFDTTISKKVEVAGHQTEWFFTVNNVLNKIYPNFPSPGQQLASPGAGIGTIPAVYDAMLRYFTVGVSLTY